MLRIFLEIDSYEVSGKWQGDFWEMPRFLGDATNEFSRWVKSFFGDAGGGFWEMLGEVFGRCF